MVITHLPVTGDHFIPNPNDNKLIWLDNILETIPSISCHSIN